MNPGTSVFVQPSQLNFKRPSSTGANSNDSFTIFNNSAHSVAFKIKTTAPKQYFVKPNHGRVEPGSRCQILVSMHSQRSQAGSADELHTSGDALKCKDKFLVQLIGIPANDPFFINSERTNGSDGAAGDEADISKWWVRLSDSQKESIVEYKLRCNYVNDSYIPSQPSLAAATSLPSSENTYSEEVVEKVHDFGTTKGIAHAGGLSAEANDGGKYYREENDMLRDQLSIKDMEIDDLKRALKSVKPGFFSPVVVFLLLVATFFVGKLFPNPGFSQ